MLTRAPEPVAEDWGNFSAMSLTQSPLHDRHVAAGAKLKLIPDKSELMESFVSDDDNKSAVKIKIDRFERVSEDTMSIAGSFTVEKRLFWVSGGRGLRAEPLFAKRAGCATQNSMHKSSASPLLGA